MVYGIKFERNGELYTKIDLAEYVRVEDKTANIDLPERARPIITDNSHLKILYAEFNPRLIYRGNAEGTVKGWEYLESQKIDLGRASVMLAMDEIYSILGSGVWPATPLVVLPAELAFLVDFLNQAGVKNLDHKIHEIRRKIRGNTKSADEKLKNGVPPIIAVYYLKENVTSIISELWICRELVERGFDVAFNPRKEGPDLYINGTRVKLEVTKKLERLNVEEYNMWVEIAQKSLNEAIIPFYPRAILTTLSLALADKLEEELNQGEIVIVDVSTLFEGMILLGLKFFSKSEELEFESAITQALNLTNNGKKAVVFYSRATDMSVAICVDAENIMELINYMKEHARGLISLRKKYPYTTIKVFSEILKRLDELEKSEKRKA